MAHGETEEPRAESWRIEAIYDYYDDAGNLAYQVVRYEGKRFRQRRPDGAGGWITKNVFDGIRRTLYRIDEVREASLERTVYIVEGEKDVETLRGRGLIATTNPGGAGKWHFVADIARAAMKGRNVVVIPDDDDVGRDHARAIAASLTDCAVRIIKLPAKDASAWFEAGGTVEQLQTMTGEVPDPWERELATALADVRGKLDAKTTATRTPLFGTDATELLQRTTFEGTNWLVTGLITRGGITIIGGEPKTAKTWLATEIALSVATGTKVCEEFYAAAGRVAYFYAEDMAVHVRNRTRALMAGAHRTLSAGTLYIEPRGAFVDVLVDEDLAFIVASVRKFGGISLLVLDPLRDVHSGEEDKSDSMREVMRRLRVLAELLTCTVVVVHHAPKRTKDTTDRRPGQNLRGSSAIHGSLDSGIYLQDSDAEDTTTFVNTVTSEVKGAKASGKFKLELRVEDNAEGEAVKATWAVEKDAAARADAKPGKMPLEDELVGEVADALYHSPDHRLTFREIAKRIGGRKERIELAVRALDKHKLVLPVMQGKKHCGWKLSTAGIAFATGEIAADPRVPD